MNEQATKLLHKCQWQVHAYCLMRNHFHFVIETPSANLMAGMIQMEEGRRAKGRRIPGIYGAVGAWWMINSERSCLPLASRVLAYTIVDSYASRLTLTVYPQKLGHNIVISLE